ncbi:hypothetical protein DERP_008083 [Dermatophagoides pteronyssinus]|uniref:Uncharacterized protein n=1 Tax=Dermatophagoides pteronyssinus TaxID=6956 RepID=A0ABQ8JK89_DERPT|nr:hypothetical protein DERP_008083 [Dermatophagoides pteronyssinus]
MSDYINVLTFLNFYVIEKQRKAKKEMSEKNHQKDDDDDDETLRRFDQDKWHLIINFQSI